MIPMLVCHDQHINVPAGSQGDIIDNGVDRLVAARNRTMQAAIDEHPEIGPIVLCELQ